MSFLYYTPAEIAAVPPYAVVRELYDGYLERGGSPLHVFSRRTPLDFPNFIRSCFVQVDSAVKELLPQFVNTAALSHTMVGEVKNWTLSDFYTANGLEEITFYGSFRPVFSVEWVRHMQTMLDAMSCRLWNNSLHPPIRLRLSGYFDTPEEALAYFATHTPEASGNSASNTAARLSRQDGKYWIEYVSTKFEGIQAYNVQSFYRRPTWSSDSLGYLEEPNVRYIARHDRLIRNADGTLDYYRLYPHTAITPTLDKHFSFQNDTLVFYNFDKSSGNQVLGVAPPSEEEPEE